MSACLLPAPRYSVACDVAGDAIDHKILAALREAFRRCFPKMEAAAIAVHVHPANFSRQLNGLERFDLRRLSLVPDVAAEFAALFAKAMGHRLQARHRRHYRRHLLELVACELDVDEDGDGPPSIAAP